MSYPYDSNTHHRKSIRLKDYDYSQNGTYFITICVEKRENRFGEIRNYEMILNDAGKMIDKWWIKLFEKFPNMGMDEYIIMPNHFHGIIIITPPDDYKSTRFVGAPLVGAQPANDIPTRAGTRPAPTIGNIIGAFKSITTDDYIHGVKYKHWPRFDKRIWQRNYYEHIIRDEHDLEKIREYIMTNPEHWEKDKLYNPK